MAISEFEIKRCEKLAAQFVEKHRRPPHVRDEVDMAYRVGGQNVELFEIRPALHDSTQKVEQPIAKATFNKTRRHWKIYWHRSDLKWHVYSPVPEVPTLEAFLAVVEDDEHCCFFG